MLSTGEIPAVAMPLPFAPTRRMPSSLDQLNVRLDKESKNILVMLQDYFGLSQAGVIKFILRETKRHIEAETGRPLKKQLGGH